MPFDQVLGQNCPQNTNYSIFGHTFFGHNLLWEIRRLLCIYRLIMRNHDLEAFWKKLYGRSRHAGAEGSQVSKPDQKVGPMGVTFGWVKKNSWPKQKKCWPPFTFTRNMPWGLNELMFIVLVAMSRSINYELYFLTFLTISSLILESFDSWL